jgi:hypothetical protein
VLDNKDERKRRELDSHENQLRRHTEIIDTYQRVQVKMEWTKHPLFAHKRGRKEGRKRKKSKTEIQKDRKRTPAW